MFIHQTILVKLAILPGEIKGKKRKRISDFLYIFLAVSTPSNTVCVLFEKLIEQLVFHATNFYPMLLSQLTKLLNCKYLQPAPRI